MNITFLLPTGGDIPVGGYKVVYQYANDLSNFGHHVTVSHRMLRVPGASLFRQYARYLKALVKGTWRPSAWFQIDSRVCMKFFLDFTPRNIGKNDVLIATSWITAEYSARLPDICGRKFYFVQDYEHFMSGDEIVRERIARTFRLGFKMIVISPSCRQLVEDCGGVVHAEVPNGLDHNLYRVTVPIDSPERVGVGFPCRGESFKRTSDAVEALRRVREHISSDGLRYWSFGNKRPSDLPDWIEFFQRPSDAELVDLYNKSAVFVVPSQYEGWGLPGSEAMCCGTALASTDSGGVRAYAIHDRNALISAPLDVEALAKNVTALLSDRSLRLRLATTGHADIGQFTWERGSRALEQSLFDEVACHA